MTTSDIACLKITLDDVGPVVMRRVEVPLSIRLDRLHAVLQAALGWTNSHLWEIRAGGAGWGIPDRDWGDGPSDAAKAKLIDVIEDTGAKDAHVSLRLRRRLGAHDQDRAHHSARTRRSLFPPHRGNWTLPAGRYRRTTRL
jgi:hypothetical protein